jgi:hypothetical protein
LVTQTGALAAPTVTSKALLVDDVPMENGLGPIVWASTGNAGEYEANLAGAFPLGKTFLHCGTLVNGDEVARFYRTSNNQIRLDTYKAGVKADDLLLDFSVEIKVYP